MCKTTTPPQAAPLEPVRSQPPNSSAGAVIPLQSYLAKYTTQFVDDLVPTTPPSLPPDVDPTAYKRVAFSLWPLLPSAFSPYYAGIFDDDTDFSASLVKIAALFAAGQFLAAAKAGLPGAANASSFFTSFNAAIQAEINANADPGILNAHFPPGSPVGLLPKASSILKITGFGSPGGPKVDFDPTFKFNLSDMIFNSGDPTAAVAIDRLGYGYISAVLNEKGFFDGTLTPGPSKAGATGRGIWLTSDYAGHTVGRKPCINDHDDAQLATARQICRLFSMIRLKQLPETDPDTNTLMQNLLNEPKIGVTTPWISPDRHPGVAPLFTILQDKIGVAGLGFTLTPNVYSEGLIIKWNDSSQVDAFNNKIDPSNTSPNTRLSGEIAVCWQNLLGDNLAGFVNGVINVLNSTINDFLDQKAL
jgi:hypothetical protein